MTSKLTKIEIYQDQSGERQGKPGEWRTRIRAANGEIIFPPEGYVNRADAEKNIRDLADALIKGFYFEKEDP